MRIEAILASPSTRCNPVESRSKWRCQIRSGTQSSLQKRCSYHLRAIPPRISCVTIRRRFILFDAAQFLPFVNSPLSTHAAHTTRRSPIRNRIFRAFPAPRPLMPSSRRLPARRSAVLKSSRQRPSGAAESWIKRTLAKMSLEEKTWAAPNAAFPRRIHILRKPAISGVAARHRAKPRRWIHAGHACRPLRNRTR